MHIPMFSTFSLFLTLLAGPAMASARAVFCHYLVSASLRSRPRVDLIDRHQVSGITQAHATQDVTDAQAMGCDAFALDLLQPGADWSNKALTSLFAAAQQHNFKLFFSLDFASSPDSASFDGALKQYLGHPAYYTAEADSLPYLSTFHEGGLGPQGWSSFKQKYGGKLHLVPNFDNLPNYYSDPASIVQSYNDVIDGLFNWETAWPPTQDHPANVSTSSDITVQSAAVAAKKEFIIPLSTFQYKDLSSFGNYYRMGDVVLPQRMEEILTLNTAPDAVEIITWNDAGESHYVGNVWPESEPPSYSSPTAASQTDHSAWRPLIASFAAAYKSGAKSSSAMQPANSTITSAVWYHTFTDASSCGNKPQGFQAATNSLNYGIILAPSCQGKGYTARVTCGSGTTTSLPLSAGLNYASVPGLSAGRPQVEVVDGSGKVVSSSTEGAQVVEGGGASCNFNYAVVGMK